MLVEYRTRYSIGVHGNNRGQYAHRQRQIKLAGVPKRIPEKLKAIRERLAMTPDQIAPFVGAKTGAEIEAYENDEDDLLVSVLWGYSKLAGIPIENLIYDDRDLWLGHRVN